MASTEESVSSPVPSPWTADEVRAHLRRILESRGFAGSARMRRFLEFTVERTLARHADQLKEYTIGVEVFDRAPSFDPRVDPIVRVEARRLRSKLKQYYAGDGARDDMRVTYPTGGYAPRFAPREVSVPAPVPATVAVLPLTNLSADPENEYFSDGLTQELIVHLTRIKGLRVAAWDSAYQMKGLDDLRSVGDRLQVRTALKGSVRRFGERLRVVAQLIETANGQVRWSQTYERSIEDVFAIQDEIAVAIARALEAELSAGEGPPRGRATGASGVSAYNFYLKGRHCSNQRNQASLLRALECFEQATREDPGFALGYAGLADAYALLGDYGVQPPEEVMPKAKAAALRALELDDTLADAHTSLGFVCSLFEWDWSAGERHYRRALELNPGHALAHFWYASDLLTPLGRMDEAFRELREAQLLDPLSAIIGVTLGGNYMMLGRHDEARREYEKVLEFDPHFAKAHSGIGRLLIQEQRFAESLEAFERARSLGGEMPQVIGPMAQCYALMGDESRAREMLGRLCEMSRQRFVPAANLALVYLCLGERETALGLLEQSAARRETQIVLINMHPAYRSLKSEPRFQAIARLVGLAPVQESRTLTAAP